MCDNPEITPEQAAASRPLAAPPRAATGDLVSLRLDGDVLATLRASGSGWRSRADEMLRRSLGLDGPAAA